MHHLRLISHHLFVEAAVPAYEDQDEPCPAEFLADCGPDLEPLPLTVVAPQEPFAAPLAAQPGSPLELALA